MGPTWGPSGPYVGPMNLAIRDVLICMACSSHNPTRCQFSMLCGVELTICLNDVIYHEHGKIGVASFSFLRLFCKLQQHKKMYNATLTFMTELTWFEIVSFDSTTNITTKSAPVNSIQMNVRIVKMPKFYTYLWSELSECTVPSQHVIFVNCGQCVYCYLYRLKYEDRKLHVDTQISGKGVLCIRFIFFKSKVVFERFLGLTFLDLEFDIRCIFIGRICLWKYAFLGALIAHNVRIRFANLNGVSWFIEALNCNQLQGPLLLLWINCYPGMAQQLHPLCSVEWHFLSNCWGLEIDK